MHKMPAAPTRGRRQVMTAPPQRLQDLAACVSAQDAARVSRNFTVLGKLYSVPFYALLKKRIASHGLVVVQATSPYFAPHAYWSIEATLRDAGYQTYPYHTYVPSFGEWGFIMAGGETVFTPPTHYRLPMRYLNAEVTREMFTFPPDMQRIAVEANHLNSQALVRYFDEDWHRVIR